MSEKLTVGISDWKICGSPDSLITYALGSCVGICLYDKNLKLAGLAHIMLPDSTAITGGAATRAKFADTAIVDMVEAMKAKGANVSALTAKIAGGAVMFPECVRSVQYRRTQCRSGKKKTRRAENTDYCCRYRP